MITKDKIAEITDKIIRFYEPEKIILFGSCVNNHQNLDSDLDLILINDCINNSLEYRETESKKPFSFLNGALKNSSVLYEQ